MPLIRSSSPRARWPQSDAGSVDWSSRWAQNLIGLWLPVGQAMRDATRWQNHATAVTGSPAPAYSARGAALQYTSSDYLTAGTSTPTTGTSWTVAAWIKFAATPVPYGMVMTREAGAGSAWEISTDGSGGNTRKLYFYSAANGQVRAATSAAAADEWHLWMVSSAGAWYTDGQANGTLPAGESSLSASSTIRINRRADGYAGNHALGPIYMWGRSFTAADAAEFYLSELAIYRPIERRIWVPSAGGGVTAALSQTLGGLTGAATGQLRIAGSVSQTLGTLTSTAAGQLPIVGSLSQALGALTSSATGQLRIAGAASQTLGALSLASTGVLGSAVTGSLSQTLGALSLAASGQLPIVGSLGQTLGALTVSAAGTLPINAALSQTLGTLTVAGAGVVPIVAQTAQTLGALTLASTGVLGATTSGVVTQTLGPLALSATARLPITAAVSQSLGALTSAAAGRVDIAAQLGVTLGNLQIAATGSTGAPITAALAQTLGLLSLSATGGAAVVPVAPLSRITAGATRSNLSRGSRPPNLSGSGR